MVGLRLCLKAASLALLACTVSAVQAQVTSPSSGGGSYLPPGPPGPPALQAPRDGFRQAGRPPLPRGRGGRGALGGLVEMMASLEMVDTTLLKEGITSVGNENFWLSDLERSATAVPPSSAPVASAAERLAARR